MTLRKRELPEGILVPLVEGRRQKAIRFRPDSAFEETPLPAVRAPQEGVTCLRLLAAIARRLSRPFGRHLHPILEQPLAHEVLERRPRALVRLEHPVDLPLAEQLRVRAARLLPVGELRQPAELRVRARRPGRSHARASPPPPARRTRLRAARSSASRTCASRATWTASSSRCSSRSFAVGGRPSSSPSSRSSRIRSAGSANRRGTSPACRFASFQLPKCWMTVCGWTVVSGSSSNSRIVGERPRRSAQARSCSRISSFE